MDSDEDWGELPLEGAYCIDYLIGEEAYLGRGFGKGIVSLLVKKIFSLPDARIVAADVDDDNKASAGALLSSGFELFDADRYRYIIRK